MKITTHHFHSTTQAYNESQSSDDIHDGDVLVVANEGVVGVLVEAWPVAVTENNGHFHRLKPGVDFTTLDGGKYAESARIAQLEATK